ncbi:MAG: competence/damage-inducible protein A [Schleiferiaceae bacterium]|nr:competence/damage-inducible protein A [Schleiferiaceae bacterium]MDP4773427.1 competence/damage-inducible protein A [Schleiferiaceae bacterium]MDP4931822.1 competence/damage-inducible protein A [Schleiferiaceae bacterium]
MQAEVIAIGTELLLGQTIDSNSAWIGERLAELGVTLRRKTVVADRVDDVLAALNAVMADTQWVIITGGLGPTQDDLTKGILNDYFGGRLVYHPEIYRHIEALFARMGRVPGALNREQAEIPDVCEWLPNAVGTAPGMLFERQGQRFVSIPGVPFEMKHIMESHVLPRIRAESDAHIEHRFFMVQGIPESELAERMVDWESSLAEGLSLAYLPSPGIVKLRLTARTATDHAAHVLLEQASASLRTLLGRDIFAENILSIEEVVGELLKASGQTVATAESCTGGSIAALLTRIPGSSQYVQGGIVAYANEAKIQLLGVSEADLVQHGAVSDPVVRAMARGARQRLNADWGLASSGIMGPDGGSAAKPLGTVWLAVSGPGVDWAARFQMGDHRERSVRKSVLEVLGRLRGFLADAP